MSDARDTVPLDPSAIVGERGTLTNETVTRDLHCASLLLA